MTGNMAAMRHLVLILMSTSLTFIDCVDHPAVLWTQQARYWTKIRGLTGEPGYWLTAESTNRQYVQTGSYRDRERLALDVDPTRGWVVWSDKRQKAIFGQSLTDSLENHLENEIELLSETSGEVRGVALDWLSGSVYFADRDRGVIGMTSAYTTSQGGSHTYRVLHSRDIGKPTSVAVDPIDGMLFWTDIDPDDPRVESSYTNGSGRRVLVRSDPGDLPMDITVDHVTKKLYYIDRGTRQVVIMNYDGSDKTVLHDARRDNTDRDHGNKYSGIAYWKDYLFVAMGDDLQIEIYNRTSGLLIDVTDIDATVTDVTVLSDVTRTPHVCQNLHCAHFCVNDGSGLGHCECAHGYFIQLDRTSCEVSHPRLIYAVGDAIWSADVIIDRHAPHKVKFSENVVKDNQLRAQALGFHYRKSTLYFSDTSREVIYRGNPDDGPRGDWSEHTVNARNTQGISVDWLVGQVYWVDGQNIMTSQMSGRYHSVLLEGITGLQAITVDPTNGLIYWSTSDPPGVYTARLDGRGGRHLITDLVEEPRGLSLDSRMRRLYIADAVAQSVKAVNIDDSAAEPILITTLPQDKLYDVTAFEDFISWTDEGVHLLMHSSQIQPEIEAELNHTDITYDVETYDLYLQPHYPSGCDANNGGCKHLCYPNSADGASRTCGCAIGYDLSPDGVSCISGDPSDEFLLFSDPFHKQLYHTSTSGDVIRGIPMATIETPVSSVYDIETGRFFWVDIGTKYISSASMNGADQQNVYKLSKDEKIDVIFTSPTSWLYCSDSSSIYRIHKTDGTKETILQNINNLRGLTVDNVNGLFYWLSDDNTNNRRKRSIGNSRVEKVFVNGTGRQVVLDSLHEPTALALFPEGDGLLYGDHSGQIISVNMTSQGQTLLMNQSGVMVTSLAMSPHTVFFTAWNMKGVYQLSVGGSGIMTTMNKEVFARITDLRYYASYLPPVLPVEDDVPVAVIAGAAAGALFLLLLLLLLLCCLRRCWRKNPEKEEEAAVVTAPPIRETRPRSTRPTSSMHIDDIDIFSPDDHEFDAESLTAVRASNGSAFQNGSARNSAMSAGQTNEAFDPPLDNSDGSVEGSDVSTTALGAAMLPAVTAAGVKRQHYRKSNKTTKPASDTASSKFELSGDQKVATVIQRLANRLRHGLSSIHFKDNSRPSVSTRPEDEAVIDAVAAPSLSATGPERGKNAPDGRMLFIPSKLHKLPRGYAPASHAVPGAVKNTWGRSRNMQMMQSDDPSHTQKT